MSKKLLILLISIYQNFLSYFFKTLLGYSNCCRYEVTCSEYARQSILKYGAIKGSELSIRRLLSCQPFYKERGDFA